jgi:hypothetical protein
MATKYVPYRNLLDAQLNGGASGFGVCQSKFYNMAGVPDMSTVTDGGYNYSVWGEYMPSRSKTQTSSQNTTTGDILSQYTKMSTLPTSLPPIETLTNVNDRFMYTRDMNIMFNSTDTGYLKQLNDVNNDNFNNVTSNYFTTNQVPGKILSYNDKVNNRYGDVVPNGKHPTRYDQKLCYNEKSKL